MNYEEVPDIITGKDLDYLSDMFEWNYGAYKTVVNSLANVVSEDVKNVLLNSKDLFYNNMVMVLDLLGGENE